MQCEWLGSIEYRWAHTLQTLRREAIIAGEAPAVIWLLEHPSVITIGKREVLDLPPAEVLSSKGIDLVKTQRGGLATWHGPGQLVGYTLLKLEEEGLRVRTMVEAIEAGLVSWLSSQGVHGDLDPKNPGVWVNRQKIASIGLHIKRGVSMHGFSLNLINDLSPYSLFNPCGLAERGVTTFAELTGRSLSPEEAASGVGAAIREEFTKQRSKSPQAS